MSEYTEPDQGCGDRRYEDRARRDILRVAGIGMKSRGSKVNIYLDRRIEGFGREDHPRREDQEHPVDIRDLEIDAQRDRGYQYTKVDPRIMRRANEDPDASSGILEALRAFDDRERFRRPCWFFHEDIVPDPFCIQHRFRRLNLRKVA